MALDDTPNRLESVWIQRDAANQYYEQINVSGSDLIIYHDSSGSLTADKVSVFASKYSLGGGPTSSLSASYMYFDGNRGILRSPYTGINLGTNNVVSFLEKFFFPFVPATISINNGTTYYETGSSQSITINGTITGNSETVFGSGNVRRSGIDWYTFTSASSYSTTDTGVTGSRTYQAFMQVGNNGSPTMIYSSTKTISFIFPYLWGMSTVAGLEGTSLYTTMSSKVIETQQTQVDSFVGTSTYIYFCYPASYADITSIKDPSGFEVSASFERSASVPVSSSGLTNNWSTLYKVYRLKLQANPNGTYTFYH